MYIYQISHVYKKQLLEMLDNTLHIKGQWEEELNKTVDDGICSRCHWGGMEPSVERILIDLKVKFSLFRILQTAYVIRINSTNKCLRTSGMVGDHMVMYFGTA